jgi:hypothetical protein
MGTPCAQCGKELPEHLLRALRGGGGASVCPHCGAPVTAAQAAPTAAQTMIGFSSPLAPPRAQQPAQPAAPPQPQAPVATQSAPMARTMLGFAAPDLRAAPPAQPQPPPQAQAPAPLPAGAKTMLGVAAPPMAPLPAPQPAAAQPVARQAPKNFGGTMLGVAMPGIAPAHSQPGVAPPQPQPQPQPAKGGTMLLEQAPPIVPAPAPFVPEAAPAAPVVVKRRGVPLAAVAVVASVVVLGGGVALLLLSRGGPPLTATAKVSADGKEQLHLVCESCPDGTHASWHAAKGTFAKHEADIDLPTPLSIGDNTFEIALDRPGMGRNETVKLVLPLAYRIRGDLSGLSQSPPVIRVDVEAERGTRVTVDGKPVTLDASGKATLSYDVEKDTTGAADDTRTIERKIPYEVLGADKKTSRGEVAVRVAVLPLHLDAPGPSLVTDQGSVWVAGKTAKGAVVTANGTSLPVGADGSFEGQVDAADGAHPVAVRAAPAGAAATKAAPRTTTVSVERVASLDAREKAMGAAASVEPRALASDPAGAAGRSAAVRGAVVDARAAHHHTVLLVDDKRGCATGPCLFRVDYGADLDVHAGDTVAAFGTVAKPITTQDGKTLPAIDASLVRKTGKR